MWNPALANQENDATYQSDSQRTGGAPAGAPFPSLTANKLFYQVAVMLRALALMMVAKGYSPNDGSTPQTADTSTNTAASALATVLENIITNADLQSSGSPYSGMLLATPPASDSSHKVPTTAWVQEQNFLAGAANGYMVQGGIGGGSGTVTFPTAFGGAPYVTCTPIGSGTANLNSDPTATSFSVTSSDGATFCWIAIGPIA
jgi:hypothetical protein